ncbi:MAG: hypothetical protein J1F38_10350 [Muribaculaceae bacterium]|nr:hypothetical protein [Muribaculaceae bacterium]
MEAANKNIVTTIADTVRNSPNGSLFFSNSFPEYDDEYVGHIMSDLVKGGELYRLGRGIYLKSKKTRFGIVYPELDYIAKAIGERDNADILPTGAMALNMLGLSTQIPMKPTYITTGSARVIEIDGRTIIFKRAVPKNFAIKGKKRSIIVQAMKALGKKNMTQELVNKIQTLIRENPEIETLENDYRYMPTWIRRIFQKTIKGYQIVI